MLLKKSLPSSRFTWSSLSIVSPNRASRVPGRLKEPAGREEECATPHWHSRDPSGEVGGQGDGVGSGGWKSEVGDGQFGLGAANEGVVGEV
jgi:hypothetical protein